MRILVNAEEMFLSKYCLIVLFYYYGFAEAEKRVCNSQKALDSIDCLCEERICIHSCYGDPKELIVPFYNEIENSTYSNDLKQDERFKIIPDKPSSCEKAYTSEEWYILEVIIQNFKFNKGSINAYLYSRMVACMMSMIV